MNDALLGDIDQKRRRDVKMKENGSKKGDGGETKRK